MRWPARRCGDDGCDSGDSCGGDAAATRRTSDRASARRGAVLGSAPLARGAGLDDSATGRAAVCCVGALAGFVRGTVAARIVSADCAMCSGTVAAACMAGAGAKAGNGSCAATSHPMMPSAPTLQHATRRARRSCARPPARWMFRRVAPGAMAGTPPDGDVAGNGCQRHARCGASMSMHEVVSVARQPLPDRAPDIPRNVHSRPNGGTPSSGVARGRASVPSTGTSGNEFMRAVAERHGPSCGPQRGGVANRDIVVTRSRSVDRIDLILMCRSKRFVRVACRDADAAAARRAPRQSSASRGIICRSCRCAHRGATRCRLTAMPVCAAPARHASPDSHGAAFAPSKPRE